MGDGVGAAGDLAAAGVLAGAVESMREGNGPPVSGAQAHHGADSGTHHCANCGTTLTGAYCSACGQGAHVHRSVLHLVEEFFHGLLHFDGKVWRTLPLLAVRPGLLTWRYVHGHRVRYVSPLALFLFCVFLMFFALSLAGSPAENKHSPQIAAEALATARSEFEADIKDARQDVAEATREASEEAPPAAGAAPTDAQKAAVARLSDLEKRLAALDAPPAAPSASGDLAASTAARGDQDDEDGLAGIIDRLNRAGKINPTGFPDGMEKKIRHALKNPELAIYKIKESASKFSFILVPLSVPFIWLMFIGRRDCRLYDHVIFALHSLSFMAVWVAILTGLQSIGVGAGGIALLATIVPPIHMFAHLRGAYRLGTFGTVWRTSFLLLVAIVSLTFYILIIFSLGLGIDS